MAATTLQRSTWDLNASPHSKYDGDDHEFQNETTELETTDDEEKIPDSPSLFEQSLFTAHTPQSSSSNSPLLFSRPSNLSPAIPVSRVHAPSKGQSTPPPYTPSACGDVTNWKEMYRTLHKKYINMKEKVRILEQSVQK
ncbi:Hypothetical predicted protein, partial [Paramuricea clavata]